MPTWVLPPEPQSLRHVREMIRQTLNGTDTGDIELVATELVTNVIRHAQTDLSVSVEVDGGTVRLEVQDGSSIMPAVRQLKAGGTGGAGLRVVEALSDEWGATQRPDGKVVWAVLPAVPPPTPSESRDAVDR